MKFVLELLSIFEDNRGTREYEANEESFERAKLMKREEICESLEARRSLVPQSEELQAKKMFIELVHLGTIKANITFKLEKKAVELDVSDPIRGFGIFNVFYSLISGVASISNSPLVFKELILVDVFAQQNILIRQITKNYAT